MTPDDLRDQIARAAQYAPHAPDEDDPWLTVADAVLVVLRDAGLLDAEQSP